MIHYKYKSYQQLEKSSFGVREVFSLLLIVALVIIFQVKLNPNLYKISDAQGRFESENSLSRVSAVRAN